jgi:hypothetical protein
MIRSLILVVAAFSFNTTAFSQKKKDGFRFIDHIDKKQIDLEYNGKVMTSYCYYDSLMKPILFPLNTVSGVTVTRGFPLEPRPGERVDHPHHTGMWLNYESVNGLDFWNNSTAIPYNLRSKYGSIIHDGLVKTEYDTRRALLEVTARWVNKNGDVLLRETTRYNFTINETDFVIDRITTLTAVDSEVIFKDIKDGFLGIRVARELEHPSTEPETILDAQGIPTRMPVVDNKGVTGEYLSSEGLKGNEVWGTRGRWVRLKGRKNGRQVSITIIDHPKNVGYPTYWHARGYGLFAANPLGQEIFSKGKDKLNFSLKAGESTTFRYRVLLHEGELLSDDEVNKLAKQFSKLN